MARKRKYAQLVKMENNVAITQDTNREFIDGLQRAMLLALYEQGKLTHVQLEYALDKLKQQRIEHAKAIKKNGGKEH